MIHIAYCFDKNYEQHAGVSVFSLLKNSSSPSECCVHFVSDHFSERFKSYLADIKKTFNFIFCLYELNNSHMELLNNAPEGFNKHVSKFGWTRVLLSSLLDEKIERVIYLDSDTIVVGDLSDLFHIDLQDALIGGVSDPTQALMIKALGLTSYINSGVLLIDLKLWRSTQAAESLMIWAKENASRLKYGDQCAINIYFEGKIKILQSCWNVFVFLGYFDHTNDNFNKNRILHFISENKPWHEWYDHPLGRYYWNYLDCTPWRGAKPLPPSTVYQGRSLARFLVKRGELHRAVGVYELILKTLLKS